MDGEEAKEETIPEEIFQDMRNIFDVFDMQDTKAVPIKELRTIMRALDFDVDAAELEIIRKKIDPDGEGFIKFANLKIVMEEKLKDVDTVEDLMEQFKHLDRDRDGFIPIPEFKQYMLNMGAKMTADELDEMIKMAGSDGQINIEEFCQALCPPKPK